MMTISISRQSTLSTRSRSGVIRKTTVWANNTDRERLLIEWIRGQGGTVGPIEIRRSERQGWYLETGEDIPTGFSLIRLPESCHLSYGDGDLGGIIDKVPEEFWSGRLSLKLLVERLIGDRSRFWPYLQTLPVGIPGIPLFYSKTAIEALQYPPLIVQIQKRCRWLTEFPAEDRAVLAETAGSDRIPDANLMGWALAAVSSRAFRTKGYDRPGSMLPLIDLCNHDFEPNCEVQPSNGLPGGVELTALRDIETGEALFINYGDLNNDDLLLDYGFLVKDNPYDNVQLAFDPEGQLDNQWINGGLIDWQRSMLEELKFIGPNADRRVEIGNADRTIDPRFLAAARIMTSTVVPTVIDTCYVCADFLVKGVSLEDLKNEEMCLEDDHELQGLRMMAKMTVAALGRFPQDLDADRSLLRSSRIGDPNISLAIAFRIEKKQLLLNAVRFLAQRIRSIKN